MIIIDNLLRPEEVEHYRKTLANAPFSDGTSTAKGMAAQVKNNGQADATQPEIRQLANQLLSTLGSHAKVVSGALPQRIFPPCFNRYSENQKYGYHVDAAIMRIPGTPDVMRSDMSMTVFLSDPESYTGGELVIQTGFGEQTVKLPAGSAVLYPSSSLHKVNPVTKGQRLAAITWMQSMVSDAAMRASLHELDEVIQSLIVSGTASRDELDRLHHVYHNLIRQFTTL
ncbi:Fe2+-dependent dioxygenase [Salinimonas sediminis]|uniref:Fe2+-dependent dioxygenase n=1 Tax=Salinimonas sediminis TaxID=2303538 RepID=A0A346NKQ3_9ALTE|nr:Fe2+-dependent dioxygenase [Salinimonas sediminis]AXR06110.1 Fe2+-dependent dioxygenase [Salinimonas sediminis]